MHCEYADDLSKFDNVCQDADLSNKVEPSEIQMVNQDTAKANE